jgi:hypothetical protein
MVYLNISPNYFFQNLLNFVWRRSNIWKTNWRLIFSLLFDSLWHIYGFVYELYLALYCYLNMKRFPRYRAVTLLVTLQLQGKTAVWSHVRSHVYMAAAKYGKIHFFISLFLYFSSFIYYGNLRFGTEGKKFTIFHLNLSCCEQWLPLKSGLMLFHRVTVR